jgi:hypothetical protein
MYYIMHHHTFSVQRSQPSHRTVLSIINQSMKQQVPRRYILINEVILQIRKINMFILSQTDSKFMFFHDSVSNTEVTWRRMVWHSANFKAVERKGSWPFATFYHDVHLKDWRNHEKISVGVLSNKIRGCYGRNRIQKSWSSSQFARFASQAGPTWRSCDRLNLIAQMQRNSLHERDEDNSW